MFEDNSPEKTDVFLEYHVPFSTILKKTNATCWCQSLVLLSLHVPPTASNWYLWKGHFTQQCISSSRYSCCCCSQWNVAPVPMWTNLLIFCSCWSMTTVGAMWGFTAPRSTLRTSTDWRLRALFSITTTCSPSVHQPVVR